MEHFLMGCQVFKNLFIINACLITFIITTYLNNALPPRLHSLQTFFAFVADKKPITALFIKRFIF